MTNLKPEFTGITDDMELDDVPDLPSFAAWPSGAFHIRLDDGIIEQEIGDVTYKKATLTLVSDPEEVSLDEEAGEVAPKPGDVVDLLFNMANEFGAGSFKKLAQPLAAKIGSKKIGEICENSKGYEMIVVMKKVLNKKKFKETGEKVYNNNLVMAACI